jgi:hypothetical protein
MLHLRRWFERGRRFPPVGPGDRELLGVLEEIEADLREVDFEEVTIEDREILIEREVIWQVRCALAGGRFDLALALQRYGVRRIADLRRGESGFRPVVIRGTDSPGRADPGAVASKLSWPRART